MKKLPLTIIAAAIDGKMLSDSRDMMIDDVIPGVRSIRRGALLFDTNRDKFAPPALHRSHFPCAIVTENPGEYADIGENAAIVQVAAVETAYWEFVAFYRNLFTLPVIGVTGTCGKTTTKEMIAHILGASLTVNATYKSYNASFRNLSYLLEIDDRTQAAVYEIGLAYPGDITTSCRYFRPQVGVITNIGIDHLQAFGTLDAYIQGKAELMAGLDSRGTLILNADDRNIQKIDISGFNGRILYFGFNERAHFKASDAKSENGIMTFRLRHENAVIPVSVPGYGEFTVSNATAAIAAAYAVGIPATAAGSRLASFRNVEKHFELKPGINGSIVIDDTWSSNPTSAAAALHLLKAQAHGRKTIAVLGKMALLGRQSAAYHLKTGENAAVIGIDQLIAMGEDAAEIGNGAIQNGMAPSRVHFCKDTAAAYAILENSLDSRTIVLVKTSMMASYSDLIRRITVPPTI